MTGGAQYVGGIYFGQQEIATLPEEANKLYKTVKNNLQAKGYKNFEKRLSKYENDKKAFKELVDAKKEALTKSGNKEQKKGGEESKNTKAAASESSTVTAKNTTQKTAKKTAQKTAKKSASESESTKPAKSSEKSGTSNSGAANASGRSSEASSAPRKKADRRTLTKTQRTLGAEGEQFIPGLFSR